MIAVESRMVNGSLFEPLNFYDSIKNELSYKVASYEVTSYL